MRGHPALFVFRSVFPLELRRKTAACQAGQMPSGDLPLAPVGALHAWRVRACSLCRRTAVRDLGWPSHAQIVLFVCPQAALLQEPLGLHRVAPAAMESSPISLYPACHALFQAEYLGCLAKHHQPVVLMAYRSYPGERRVCRDVRVFQLAFLRQPDFAQRPACLSRRVEPLGRDGPVLYLFQSAWCLMKSPDSRQRLALLRLAKPRPSPALSRRRALGAEYSLDSRS